MGLPCQLEKYIKKQNKISCFTQLAADNLWLSKIHEKVAESESFALPGLPDNIVMTKTQLPGLFNLGNSEKAKEMKISTEHIRELEFGAYGLRPSVLINSFEELETRYINEYKKQKQGRVWCIGPFSQYNKNDLDKAQRGSKAPINEHGYMEWLDSQHPGSIIYVCLGSLRRQTPPQFIELTLGLEDSGFPFILVVKGGAGAEKIEKWLAEDSFEKRVKGRGVLVRAVV
ncbi:hypothetical protein OSB04_010081 [Centaurea solstitialis]|uniref:UDP-glycosyltransferase n=1 Tax=Centaurea solstitialis TaxID=347529 RepID=A0AA38WCH5_9ASTR|nr:hypothetical protein OSB04_010081 [Centaurea solstitialis]